MNLANTRIPTIIGLILLIVSGAAGVYFIERRVDFFPRANPEFAPQDLTVTNITDNSFTLSWITAAETEGFVQFGTTPPSLNQTQRDDRDELTGTTGQFFTHHVTLRGLEPQTTYHLRIGSGRNQFFDNEGSPYQVVTAPTLNTPPPADTAYGEIRYQGGSPAAGAIVYLQLPNAIRLSTLAKDSGQWAISLPTARTQNLADYVSFDPVTTRFDLLVQAGQDNLSRAVVTTANDQPVPTLTLGENYDFTGQSNPITPATPQEKETLETSKKDLVEPTTQSGFNLSPLGKITPTAAAVTLLNPAEDEEPINTQKPDFYGTAPAGTKLTITVESNPAVTATLTVSNRNTWSWTPPANLNPGPHTITVSYTDSRGVLQTLTRSFTVYAVGESDLPAFTATPSASPSPRPSPTPTPKSTPTPTLRPSPTPTPTPKPSPTPTLRPSPTPATTSATLTPGVVTPTLILVFLAFLSITAGLFLKLTPGRF